MAEKTALRFAVKEFAGIVNDLTKGMCEQAINKEIEGPCIDGARQLRELISQQSIPQFSTFRVLESTKL